MAGPLSLEWAQLHAAGVTKADTAPAVTLQRWLDPWIGGDRGRLLPALLLLPLSYLAEARGCPPLPLFVLAGLGVIPLALLLSQATEAIAERSGPTVGALCTAIFGNCAELIIALSALRQGLIDVVKASITGAILSDVLLVTGIAMLCGGLRHSEQSFQPAVVRTNGAAMTLAVIALALPAALIATSGIDDPVAIHGLSMTVAVILIVIYLLTLVFSLVTHQHLFDTPHLHEAEADGAPAEAGQSPGLGPWVLLLLLSTAGLALQSELFVSSLEPATAGLGFSALFTGVIVVPIVGGFSEYVPAVRGALRDQLDLPLSLAMGSSLLVALLIAPALVLSASALGQPMDLDFTGFEVIALGLGVLIVNLVTLDARSNWLEGVLLLATYAILGAAFFYYPV
jgi:Ca2+:H+ antiporter